MQTFRHYFRFFAAPATILLMVGCAAPSLYKSWGQQVSEAPKKRQKVDDVSLLLGSPPSHCDPIEDSKLRIGVGLDRATATVKDTLQGSVAARAGLIPGDRITFVEDLPVTNEDQFAEAMQQVAQVGKPVRITTTRGIFALLPS